MKKIYFLAASFFSTLFFFSAVSAEEIDPENLKKTIVFHFELQTFSLPLEKNPDFIVWKKSINTEKDFCDWPSLSLESSPEEFITKPELDEEKLRDFFSELILPKVNRDPQSVRIFRDEKGEIFFEGAGIQGVSIDLDRLISLTKMTIENGVFDVEIPVVVVNPEVVVEDPELREMGISELLSVGVSDFSGSSWDRMHNVETGKNRFNGLLIPMGETFSFNENLGSVDAAHGYLPELVITGPKLSREYGGGLCQVSSTAFRAALLAGLPIVERYNHSFAVHYYEPWGTDATIYLGGKDFKFQNDTSGAILVQTTMDRATHILQFHFYGTSDKRVSKFFGPFLSNRTSALPSKVEKSAKLAPGQKLALSHAVAGFDAEWTRLVFSAKDSLSPNQGIYRFFSRYQPRAEWTLVGEQKSESSDESSI